MDRGALVAVVRGRVALIGGGYALQALAETLPQGSFVITSRSAETCGEFRARGWLAAQLDLTDRASVASFAAAHPGLSAAVDSVPPLRGAPDPALGVRHLIEALEGTEISRIIYLSTTGVFGVRDGSWVSESTPAAPWHDQGRARLRCEETYRAGRIPSCAFRLPAIYGPGRGLLQAIRAGTYSLIGSGAAFTNRIHVRDLAAALKKALSCEELPAVLCVADDSPAPASEVAAFVCAQEGLPAPPSITEEEALRRGAFTMLSNQRISNAEMKRVLGLVLSYPSYREGFAR